MFSAPFCCCSSHEEQFSQSLSGNLSFKVESPPGVFLDMKHFGLQLHDQISSSSQSTGLSQQEMTSMGRADSQDHCISAESDESFGKHGEGHMKPVFVLRNMDFGINPPQADMSQPLALPYTYADPYVSGLFGAYGPQAIVQPQMVGMGTARVPLPLDLAEDGPIYVNAKQYHGILRRRQMRAKLEAQNKLVKNRKPYLHESRHLHALNRMRGSGGRFLSAKKARQPDHPASPTMSCSAPVNATAHFVPKADKFEFEVHQSETREHGASITSSDITRMADSDAIFHQQPDRRFSGISSHIGVAMQCSGGGLMGTGTGSRHCTPIVR